MAPIRIGGIGCGGMASGVHFPAIQKIPELKLVALCDIDETRLAEAADRFRVADTFTRFEEMLDSGKLDAVSLIGPPSLHVMAARACLTRQIPFMTEKPLALTVSEARELADLAERYGDCGQVGAQPLRQRDARQQGASRALGPIVSNQDLPEHDQSPSSVVRRTAAGSR